MWRQNAAPVSGGRGIKLYFRFQKMIERVFFGGRTTAWSRRVSFWLGNTIVIFGLFFVLTQLLLYRWTGDEWAIEGKEGVLADFRDALDNDYRWRK